MQNISIETCQMKKKKQKQNMEKQIQQHDKK